MLTMKVAMTFFVCSMISCIFFTLGRLIEKSDAKTVNLDKLIQRPRDRCFRDSRESGIVIDVEYEDVVDLNTYRERKEYETRDLINTVSSFELVYSERDQMYVRIPREVAKFIRYIQGEIR